MSSNPQRQYRQCRECGAEVVIVPPEPPVGTWVRDRHGALSMHQPGGGWAEPGFWPFGRWEAMWEARGPLVECGPWGRELAASDHEEPV